MSFWKKKKTDTKPTCKRCGLFDPKSKLCGVVILHEGEKTRLPVDPQDECFFEGQFVALDDKQETNFKPEIQQVRWWVEGTDGQPTKGNGTVKFEAPEEFFKD
jgi:hypothetical protein